MSVATIEIKTEYQRLTEYLDSLYELRLNQIRGGAVKRFGKADTALSFHTLSELEDQIRRTEEKICGLKCDTAYYKEDGKSCCQQEG